MAADPDPLVDGASKVLGWEPAKVRAMIGLPPLGTKLGEDGSGFVQGSAAQAVEGLSHGGLIPKGGDYIALDREQQVVIDPARQPGLGEAPVGVDQHRDHDDINETLGVAHSSPSGSLRPIEARGGEFHNTRGAGSVTPHADGARR